MLVYIISFIISIVFMYWALNKNDSSMFNHIMAITPPVLLLTFRAEDCGTDTTTYIAMYDMVGYESLTSYITETRLELFFALLLLGVKSIGLSVEFLFFLCGLLTIVPVYFGCIKMRSKINPLFPMALFYLMFYQYSFNIVRQSIAMSFIFLATVYLVENRYLKSLLWGLTAIFFHAVAFTFFIVFLSFVLLKKNLIKGMSISIILSVAIIYFLQSLYEKKIDAFYNYLEAGKASMEMSYLFEMIANALLVLLIWKKDKLGLRNVFLFISCLVAIIISLSTVAPYFFRIANSLDILLLIYIPLAIKSVNSVRQKTIAFGYISFAIFYWWFIFIFNGSGRSYPYIFSTSINLF